ncbi:hypothetical protein EI42_02859 [Thermosporothrix hazakensis]|jgi:hypothetical protein|uniref:Uncharacterized protein n=2 Tax=Thermosporothrix TaxID=768650 RepID=A0A326UG64_THEHA|nr:hypothetical protein EI42_02859 [Thermosporothrix hazakensis]BBH85850.1 hypothetical protein KTC_06010 [Thermosporothrix sp. COM3]GCE45723.1 hypothetical protein KTH_05920 [Thermosporothrix hazakensis]
MQIHRDGTPSFLVLRKEVNVETLVYTNTHKETRAIRFLFIPGEKELLSSRFWCVLNGVLRVAQYK